jgi:hypothetical protein
MVTGVFSPKAVDGGQTARTFSATDSDNNRPRIPIRIIFFIEASCKTAVVRPYCAETLRRQLQQ